MRSSILGLTLIMALGVFVHAQVITGSWETEILIDPQAVDIPTFLDFSTDLTVTYEIAGWAFTSFTQLDDTGWIDQTFSAGGVLGAYSFGSSLDFDPAGSFESWEVTAGVSTAGMTFDSSFTLIEQDVTLTLGGRGSTGLVEVDVETTFGGDDNDICDLIWSGLDVTVEFLFCCAEVTSTIEFNCDGFEYLTFDVDGIQIPNLPWLVIDAELAFDLQSKSLTLSPGFDFGTYLCFDIYVSPESSGGKGPEEVLSFESFSVDGLGIECELGTVTFTGISYWGDTGKPGALGEYWEMYQIASNDDGCCGPFSFEIAVFFDQTSNNLGDVALFTAETELGVSEQFEFSLGVEIDAMAGTIELSAGFVVTW